jgi:lipid II:glycine glycyltransferase (peptidoglycan interpeptide bridge formation enzyme)
VDVRPLTTAPDLKAYEDWISHHPDATLWQSPAWRAYQQAIGRETRLYGVLDGGKVLASALVVIDKTTGGFSTWDIPRGPLTAVSGQRSAVSNEKEALEELFDRIVCDASQDRCLAIFLSPAIPLPAIRYPLSASYRHEQPEATLLVDLTASEEDILAKMHQKGRYNIKVADKNGVQARESSDVETYARLAHETAARDGFRAPSRTQFAAFLRHIPGSFLLIATSPDGMPIAGLIGAVWKECGIYYYGASSNEHRALMAPYALQWAAMRRCKAAGCLRYDLLGVAPPDAPDNHPWRGITGFKEKFGGKLVTYPRESTIKLRPLTLAALRLKRNILG